MTRPELIEALAVELGAKPAEIQVERTVVALTKAGKLRKVFGSEAAGGRRVPRIWYVTS